MSWYDTAWTHREAIAVDNVSGASTIDITCALPSDWGFWDTVKSDGTDIRICDADGVTLLTYQVNSWNYSAKPATVQVDAYAAPNDACVAMVWIYWGNAAASSAAGSFSADSPKTGNIEPICSLRPVIKAGSLAPGRSKPSDQIAKSTDETMHVNVDFRGVLNRRCERVNGSLLGEELDFIKCEVKLNGVTQSSMIDLTKTRFIQPALVQLYITGGDSGSDYTIAIRASTTKGRMLNPRILLRVKDV